MHGEVQRQWQVVNTRVTWRTLTAIKAPRCGNCKEAHGKVAGKMGRRCCRAAIGTAILPVIGSAIGLFAGGAIGKMVDNKMRLPDGVAPESAKSDYPPIQELVRQRLGLWRKAHLTLRIIMKRKTAQRLPQTTVCCRHTDARLHGPFTRRARPLRRAVTDETKATADRIIRDARKRKDHFPKAEQQPALSISEMEEQWLKAAANIITNAWRAKVKMLDADTNEPTEPTKRVYRHVEAIFDALKQMGVEHVDPIGRAYDSGMALKGCHLRTHTRPVQRRNQGNHQALRHRQVA